MRTKRPGDTAEGVESTPEARIESFLASRVGVSLEVSHYERLIGDASTRVYFRVFRPRGQTALLAALPSAFEPEELDFLRMAELFRELGVRVPRVHTASGPEGILVLEDFGDLLLQDAVRDAGLEEKRALYRRSVDLLARIQAEAAKRLERDPSLVPVVFTEKKFTQELDFFRRHFLEGIRSASLDAAEREALGEQFARLSRELVGHPFVLCHRDFHARNLMIVEGEIGVIDFQDARLGPRTYDLVSLLGDSYVEHDNDLIEEMKLRFSRTTGVELGREYDVAALQRNLKALGTFGYQIGQRGNDVYRPYVRYTLSLVRRNLGRNRGFDDLRRILARHLEELA
jgi:aminoglycoside/choline kinase family phosphotransferase